MFFNLLLAAFLIFMAYWWALQGLYSGLLHLLVTVLAAAMAFAFWEPISMGFLVKVMYPYAWGVGLILPFFFYLLCFRVFLDKFAPRDLLVFPAADYLGGGFTGLLAGYVSAGILTIGLGFLPLSSDILNYQPFSIDSTGQVIENPPGDLWVKVDTHTADFFSFISDGSFGTPNSLRRYQPDLATQASLHRMGAGYDPNASVTAVPESIEVTAALACPSPVNFIDDRITDTILKAKVAGGENIRTQGYKLVAVSTTWKSEPRGTYDSDQALRVYSTQIRLATFATHDEDPAVALTAPVGYTKEDTQSATKDRTFTAFKDDKAAIFSSTKTTLLTWLFLIPNDRSAQYILIRHLRFPLPGDVKDDKDAIKLAAGHLPGFLSIPDDPTVKPPEAEPGKTPDGPTDVKPDFRVGRSAGTIAENIAITDTLPQAFSKNLAAGFTTNDNRLVSGTGDIGVAEGLSKATAIDRIELPSHQVSVRAKVAREQAQSVLGAAVSTAAALNAVYLQDAGGEQYFVVGYVLLRSDRTQRVHINLDAPLRSSKELPVREMKGGDSLFLYFAVPKGTKLTEFHIGPKTFQAFDLAVPK
ncbi:MAG: CvpA family protein [Planctomycetota bacterium]|nr:CvpA family protein [Planctomycetota bacterium]